MTEKRKKSPRLLLALIIVLGISLLAFNVAADSVAVQTTGQFRLELPGNPFVGPLSSGLAFQPDSNHLIVIVCSNHELGQLRGDLNASAASVWFLKGGTFQFTVDPQTGASDGSAFIRIGGNASKITVQGSTNYPGATTFTTTGTYNILLDVKPGQTITISWDIYPEIATIPVMLIIGIAGVLFVFFGILVTLYKLREHDWEWLAWGFLIVLIGICLVIAWLWS